MASPGSLCIVIGAGGLAVLGQADAEPQHQMTQQRPAHAARISSFLGCSRGLPGPSSPPSASGALVESLCSCSSGEITLSRARTPQTPPASVCSPWSPWKVSERTQEVWPSCLGLSFQNISERTGPSMGEKSPGLQPYPHSPHTTPPHPAQETSVDQVATSCWLVPQFLFR